MQHWFPHPLWLFVWMSTGLRGVYQGLVPMILKWWICFFVVEAMMHRFFLPLMRFLWVSVWGVPGSDTHSPETRFLLLLMQFVWLSADLHGMYQGLMP